MHHCVIRRHLPPILGSVLLIPPLFQVPCSRGGHFPHSFSVYKLSQHIFIIIIIIIIILSLYTFGGVTAFFGGLLLALCSGAFSGGA